MSRRKVSEEEIQEALKDLPGWEVKDGKLHKEYKFKDFAAAMGWMVQVGIFADKLNHHPDWCNGYNKVTVDLMTHDMGALSTWDIELAMKMEELAS